MHVVSSHAICLEVVQFGFSRKKEGLDDLIGLGTWTRQVPKLSEWNTKLKGQCHFSLPVTFVPTWKHIQKVEWTGPHSRPVEWT